MGGRNVGRGSLLIVMIYPIGVHEHGVHVMCCN